ncbi:hypothetical protein [Iningainema tapete]|uniref:Uncharacterized protein n=1 Tax=Iningainema tapete BLCC-T55 TaxID=2748662 RepID=A0A8J6XQG9_9CYAN|nr:hypothetical protein [Iningainema tapete BLCC-T55]
MTFKKQHKTFLSTNQYLELKNQEQILQLELNKQQHLIGRDPITADLVIPEDWQVVGRCQAVLPKEGQDYRILM